MPLDAKSEAEIRHSACPHDCPSTCALEVECFGARPHRPGPWRQGQPLHRRRGLRQGGALCRAGASPGAFGPGPCGGLATRASGIEAFQPISWENALERGGRGHVAGGAAPRGGGGLALPLCRDHGPGAARWSWTALRHAKKYSRQVSTICVTLADSGWKAAVGAEARRGCAGDRRERLDCDLGRQPGLDPGERHDPRGQGPQATRCQARGGRSLI